MRFRSAEEWEEFEERQVKKIKRPKKKDVQKLEEPEPSGFDVDEPESRQELDQQSN